MSNILSTHAGVAATAVPGEGQIVAKVAWRIMPLSGLLWAELLDAAHGPQRRHHQSDHHPALLIAELGVMVGRIKDLTGSTPPALYAIAALSLVCAAILAFGMPERLRQREHS